MSGIDENASNALDEHLQILRLREAPTSSEIARRRMSHAGFDSHREVELARRGSLPAHLMFPKDEDRKLHKSSACFDFIKDQNEVKVVLKNGKQRALDERLGNFFKARSEEEECSLADDQTSVKRRLSDTNLNEDGIKSEVEARSSSSETDLSGAEFKDPEQ